MKRTTLLVSAVIVLAGLVLASVAIGSGSQISQPQTIRVLQSGGFQLFLPLNTQKHNDAGDEFVVNGPVLQSGHPAGHLHAVCFAVDRSAQTAECTTMTFLHGGAIASYGPITFTTHGRTEAAVTGGTGMYRNARGQVTFINTSASTEGLVYEVQP
jgi:hypothetical protein